MVSVANEEFFHELEEKSAETYKTFTRGIIDDLQEFKKLVCKSTGDPLCEIDERSYYKSVADFLEKKRGEYSAMIALKKYREEYLVDYLNFLYRPCRSLDDIWTQTLTEYETKYSKDEAVASALSYHTEVKDCLENARVCATLLKSSTPIGDNAYYHLLRTRMNPVWYASAAVKAKTGSGEKELF